MTKSNNKGMTKGTRHPHVQQIVEEAQRLYAIGLNPLPMRYGTKVRFNHWHVQKASRLDPTQLTTIFGDILPVNLGVICGRSSQNLFSIDCDTPKRFERIGAEIRRLRLMPWIRSSSRGGHYVFLCIEGEVASEKRDGYDILGANSVLQVPPSLIGDTGEIIEWTTQPGAMPPWVSVEDLAFLNLRVASFHRVHQEKNSLPLVANQVLIEKDLDKYRRGDGSVDNSSAEYAACLSLIGAGRKKPEILALLAQTCPPHYRKVGAKDFERNVVDAAYRHSNASEFLSDVSRLADDYERWLDHQGFPGQRGNSMKAVLHALARRMRLDRSIEFRATQREIVEGSGLSAPTVRTAVAALLREGYITRANSQSRRDASRFTLNCEPMKIWEENRAGGLRNPYASVPEGDVSHDAWQVGGLGRSAYYVMRHLRVHPALGVRKIAEAIDKAPSTVSGALKRLQVHGLVTVDDGLWSVSVDADHVLLDTVARNCLTYGRAAVKADTHAAERMAFATMTVKNALTYAAI